MTIGDQIRRSLGSALSPVDRYYRDPEFAALVDLLESFIHRCRYMPTELREAALLAAIRYEQRQIQPRSFNYWERPPKSWSEDGPKVAPRPAPENESAPLERKAEDDDPGPKSAA